MYADYLLTNADFDSTKENKQQNVQGFYQYEHL